MRSLFRNKFVISIDFFNAPVVKSNEKMLDFTVC